MPFAAGEGRKRRRPSPAARVRVGVEPKAAHRGDIHGFDPNGPPGKLDAVRRFATADDLPTDIINARVWGGLHYRFSDVAGITLGTKVAQYDLQHGFQPAT